MTKQAIHIVVFAHAAWGHIRPLCSLSARITKLGPVVITFLTPRPYYHKVLNELSRNFEPDEVPLQARIRVVALSIESGKDLLATFATAFKALTEEAPVTCLETGVRFEVAPSPSAAIIDVFAAPFLPIIRKLSKKPMTLIGWYGLAASSIFYAGCPANISGRGDLRSSIAAQALRTGRTLKEAAAEVVSATNGSIMNLPGLPPMYDYEFFPQEHPLKSRVGILHVHLYEFLEACDAVIVTSPDSYEPKAMDALTRWFGATSRPVYPIGPLFPSGAGAIQGDIQQSKSDEVVTFLEKTLRLSGPRSLVYISFGSIFWSTNPEKVCAFLDALIEKRVPFVFSHASEFSDASDAIVAKTEAYDLGLLAHWAPQQAILAHAATGWFLTHCGINSILESIHAGVPMICWPFELDQVTNAVHLTENLGIAYEPLEIRTGHGLRKSYRTGHTPVGTLDAVLDEARQILEKAFGEDGATKRTKVLKLKTTIDATWGSHGSSQLALQALFASFSSNVLRSSL